MKLENQNKIAIDSTSFEGAKSLINTFNACDDNTKLFFFLSLIVIVIIAGILLYFFITKVFAKISFPTLLTRLISLSNTIIEKELTTPIGRINLLITILLALGTFSLMVSTSAAKVIGFATNDSATIINAIIATSVTFTISAVLIFLQEKHIRAIKGDV